MASPQTGNGYTAVANEIIEELIKRSFTATQLKIIMLIRRQTYGWKGRKSAELSLSFFQKATNVSKRYLSDGVNELIKMNVIKEIKKSTYNSPRIVGFNKDYDTWKCRTLLQQMSHSSTVELKQDTTVEPQFNTTVEPQFNQNNYIKTILKQRKTVVAKSDLDLALDDFYEMRKSKKKPMTERAKQLLMNNLLKLSEDSVEQVEILEQSILHTWDTVYPLKNQNDRHFKKSTGGIQL